MVADLPMTSKLLTVIITTSITPSAPSTELLSSVLDSFRSHCPNLGACRVIVVLDGYDQVVPRARLKKGQITWKQEKDFGLYKINVKNLILEQHYPGEKDILFTQTDEEAEYGSPIHAENVVIYTTSQTHDKRVTFIEPSRRLGFGLAVRSALRITETPYVWVQQHDWILASDVPINPLLQIMRESESDAKVPMKYICLPAARMLSYAISPHVTRFTVLRKLTSSLMGDFSPASQPHIKIPLTPLFFWHDKPHVVSTAHYLARVFPSRLTMLRGDFIEDKIGQYARAQMKEGLWTKWACWLYYPDDGKQVCVRHLHGRIWQGAEREAEKISMRRQEYEHKALDLAEGTSSDVTEDQVESKFNQDDVKI